MKKTILLFTFVLFTAVSFAQNESTVNVQNTRADVAVQENNLSRQEACKIFSQEEIAQFMEVETANVQVQDMSFGKKRSICYYYTPQGNRKLFIRKAWKSEKAAMKKVLESQYTRYLAEGEKSISEYREVEKSADYHTLYGIGQDMEGKYIHLLRKRFDNKAELQIEWVKESKDENGLEKLTEILEQIK